MNLLSENRQQRQIIDVFFADNANFKKSNKGKLTVDERHSRQQKATSYGGKVW